MKKENIMSPEKKIPIVLIDFIITNSKNEFLQINYDRNGSRILIWTTDSKKAWRTNSLFVFKYMLKEITIP